MAVHFRFPETGALNLVGFTYSPALEAIYSMRVALEPKRYPLLLSWARRTKDLPDGLRDEMRRLRFAYEGPLPGVFEIGLHGDFPSIDDELDRIAAFDDDIALYEFCLSLGAQACSPTPDTSVVHTDEFQRTILDTARDQQPDAVEILEAAFEDPATIRRRLVRMLAWYWDAAFAEEWGNVEPRLIAEIEWAGRELVQHGPIRLLKRLVPELRISPDGRDLSLPKSYEREVDVAAKGGLSIVPSVYCWPCVAVEADDPWPTSIIYPITELRRPARPVDDGDTVVEQLKALADGTRLRITQLVAEQPRSTRELAEMLALSEPAVSRHLTQLRQAGLLASERDGYYVLYSAVPSALTSLGPSILRSVGLDSALPDDDEPELTVVGPRPPA